VLVARDVFAADELVHFFQGGTVIELMLKRYIVTRALP